MIEIGEIKLREVTQMKLSVLVKKICCLYTFIFLKNQVKFVTILRCSIKFSHCILFLLNVIIVFFVLLILGKKMKL